MTYFYRYYFFVIVYFIQMMLTLKLVNETLIRIDFANDFFIKNKESKLVKINTIIFGGIYKELTPEDVTAIQEAKLWYNVYILVSLMACQCWKNTKWVEIRYKTRHIADKNKFSRFLTYLNDRVKQDNEIIVMENRKAFEKKTGQFKKKKATKQEKKYTE